MPINLTIYDPTDSQGLLTDMIKLTILILNTVIQGRRHTLLGDHWSRVEMYHTMKRKDW